VSAAKSYGSRKPPYKKRAVAVKCFQTWSKTPKKHMGTCFETYPCN
jgi:hypothetical protein